VAAELNLAVIRSAFSEYCRRRKIEGEERYDVDFYDFYRYLISRPAGQLPAGVSIKSRKAWLDTFKVLQTPPGRRALDYNWDLILSTEYPGRPVSRTSPRFIRLAAVVGWGEGKVTTLFASKQFGLGDEVGPGLLSNSFGQLADGVHRRLRRWTIPELRRESIDVGDGEVLDRAASLLVDLLRENEIPNDEQASLLSMLSFMRPILDDRSGGSGWR
jgi:hypothetical protein